VISHIPYGSKVLDAGCGSGRFLEMLREKRSCQGVGLDISDVAVNLTASRGFAAFVCKLPDLPKELESGTFNVCVLLETLEHISKPVETIERLATLLKEDGLIVVSVPDNCMTPEEFDEHVNSFTQQTLGDLLRAEFHLEVMTSYEVSAFRYLFVVGRKISDAEMADIQNCRHDGPVL
jgi:2-polyprenyl-3-methyl-5-hydroxy-6-metoxy-1,4-benzoquinol methylase